MKILALLAAALFAVPAFAGESLPLPISDRVLTFEVALFASGARVSPPSVRVSAREGALFYVEDQSLKIRFGFVAKMDRQGFVSAAPSFVGEDAGGWLDLVPAGPAQNVPRLRGAVFAIGEISFVRLRFIGSSVGSFPDAPAFRGHVNYADREQVEALRKIYGNPDESICCIGFKAFRACGHRVDISGVGVCG